MDAAWVGSLDAMQRLLDHGADPNLSNSYESWYVRSRAPKFQPYFESGFPYGHDQWISQMATGWAAAALTLAIDATPS
jgi:hypothetical protein